MEVEKHLFIVIIVCVYSTFFNVNSNGVPSLQLNMNVLIVFTITILLGITVEFSALLPLWYQFYACALELASVRASFPLKNVDYQALMDFNFTHTETTN